MARLEQVVWWSAATCAGLLLFAPMSPRTTWVEASARQSGARITEGVGWLGVAPFLAVVAIVALIAGRRARPIVLGSVLAASAAALVFGGTAVGMATNWLIFVNGTEQRRGYVLDPVPAFPWPAGVAFAGLLVSLVLLGRWSAPPA